MNVSEAPLEGKDLVEEVLAVVNTVCRMLNLHPNETTTIA
jgi:hypothetical protein